MKRGRLQCKDIPDLTVLRYAAEWQEGSRKRMAERKRQGLSPFDLTPADPPGVFQRLQEEIPDVPAKVLLTKLYRMADRGLLEYGCSVSCAWPTREGEALMAGAGDVGRQEG